MPRRTKTAPARKAFPLRVGFACITLLASILAAATASAADVRVRYGEHADFIRVVFDWPDRTNYVLDLKPDGVVLRFEGSGAFDFSRLSKRSGLTAAQPDDGVARIAYAPAKSVRHWRYGKGSVVVDLYRTNEGAALPKAAAPPHPPSRPAERAAKSAPPAPEAPKLDSPAEPLPPADPAEATRKPGPPDLSKIPPAGLAATLGPSPDAGAAPNLGLTVAAEKEKVFVDIDALDDAVAAFTRAGAHWIVVSRPYAVDLTPAIDAGLDIVQLPFPDKTVLHVKVTPGYDSLSAWRSSGGWRFAFGEGLQAQGVPLKIERRQETTLDWRLVVRKLEGAKLLRVPDPEVGDALFVVALPEGKRVSPALSTPDAVMIETAIGIVVAPRSEGVGARVRGDVLQVRKRGGLRLSDPERILLPSSDVQASAVEPRMWRGEGAYLDGFRNRLAEMNGVASFGRNATRMNLAEFSLARGFATEALAFLQIVARDDLGAPATRKFRAMRGIARAMLGQHDLAAVDLDLPALAGDPQVEIWRALGLAEAGDVRVASAKFRRFWLAAAEWPSRHRIRLSIAAGEAALRARQPDVAERFLQWDVAPTSALDPPFVAALAIVDGGIKLARSDLEGAKIAFEIAKAGGDAATRARAELELVRMGLASGEIEASEGAERLTRLQLRWRGDRVEYETLKQLGQLRLENREYRLAFEALGEAADSFSARFDTSDVRALMSFGFEQAFVGGAARELSAVDAVALFEEFESLAPPGSKGDLALAELARRLASLDLLDEADDIMSHLVRRRLDGAERAAIGSELAEIQIARRDWAGALATLDHVADDGAKLDAERAEVDLRSRANALAGLGRITEALDLLDDAEDQESLDLRAALAWGAADWVAARDVYRRKEALGAFDGETLAPADQTAVVRWAMTATMLKNWPEVGKIAERFIDRIEDAPLASALRALAAPGLSHGDALVEARDAISGAENLANAVGKYSSARRRG